MILQQPQRLKRWGWRTIELEKINLYTLRPVTKEEVFTCKVLACSNEVDRDLECFSQEALQSLPNFIRAGLLF